MVRVTIDPGGVRKRQDALRERIMQVLRRSDRTAPEIAAITGDEEEEVYRMLKILERTNKVERETNAQILEYALDEIWKIGSKRTTFGL